MRYLGKKRMLRVLSLLLTAALLMPAALAASYTVAGVGTVHRDLKLTLADQTILTQTTMTHSASGRQEERYIEWGVGSAIQAMVAYGNSVHGGALTLSELNQRLKAQNKEAVAIMNADFFTLNNGVPEGILVTGGIIRTSDNYQEIVGFPRTGGAFIVKSPLYTNMTVKINGADKIISIDQINHTRTRDRLILFTPDFSSTTQTNTDGTHVILNVTGNLTIGGTVTGTVKEIVKGSAAAKLVAGQMVLSVDAKGPVGRLDGLTAGMTVSIRVSAGDSRLQDCSYAVGGYQRLITSGQVAGGLAAGTGPRTAIGIKSDGSCILYTVDGRQDGYSVGLTLTNVANRLKSLGCVDAVNLDGGGSTILGAKYPGQDAMTVTGKPSDGSQRRVADYIVLVNDMPSSQTVDRIFVYPYDVTMLKNATVQFKGYATDINYHTLTAPGLTWWNDDSEVGTLNSGGYFTAVGAGETAVGATGAGVTGGAVVRVVEEVDSVSFSNDKTGKIITELAASPGETVNLSALAYVDSVQVTGQNTCFMWEVVGNIGQVDANGKFTAVNTAGASGSIAATYENKTYRLPVSVGKQPQVVETFETDNGRFTPGDANIGFTYERDQEKARYGTRAGRISYNFAGLTADQSTLTLSVNVPLPNTPSYLNLWVSGDNSGNMLGLKIVNTAGGVTDLNVQKLDFTGYRLVQVKLPANAARVSGVSIQRVSGGAASGLIRTDQWVAAYQLYNDVLPPVVSIDNIDYETKPGFVSVEARVVDDDGVVLRKLDVSLLWDGAAATFTYDTVTGRVTASIPLTDYRPHRLTLEAVDPAGNRNRRGADVTALPEGRPHDIRFADVEETHWARGSIAFLDGLGVLTGTDSNGQSYFYPSRALTRSDMAVYIARVLKIDLSLYDKVTLPFTDTAKIPVTALREVRALYALGVIKGKNSGGKLFFDPAAPITRAEFCTIIGRALPRGYVPSSTLFTDNAKIPSYAREHIQVMVSMGIIGGYQDNTMRPGSNISRAEAAKVLSMLY